MKYALVNQAIISVIINLFLNGIITWYFFRNVDPITLWGIVSISMDLLQATFYFTFYTSFFITRAVYRSIEDNKIIPIKKYYPWLSKYPATPFYGSITLGIFASIIITPIVIGGLILLNLSEFSLFGYILFKSLYGGTLALFGAPLFTFISINEFSLKLRNKNLSN